MAKFKYLYENQDANIYFIRDGMGNIKIGIARNVQKRKKALQTANPNKLEIFCIWHVKKIEHAYEIESYLHKRFANSRKCGEWFEETDVIEYLRNGELNVPRYMFENIDW